MIDVKPTAPVASLGDVSLKYGRVQALSGITLNVPSGQMVGLIGPDGVGKSSLLSLLSGARVIQSGRIQILGGDMALINPVSSLEGFGAVIGRMYPASHFLIISRGVFNKSLGFSSLSGSFWPMMLAVPVIFGVSVFLLKKQET